MEHDTCFAKATEALKHDHRVIERVLTVLERLSRGSDGGTLESWKKTLDFVRNFADRCHHLKEEKILFPALEERGIPREGGPIGMMLAEHEEGRGYVRAMFQALSRWEEGQANSQALLRENAHAYLRLLPAHIQKEDEILFQMAEDALSPEDQKHLLNLFEEYEAKEIGAGVHEKYVKLAEELEGSCG